jgi:hypothetical protein
VHALATDYETRQSISAAGRRLVDGRGRYRIVEAISDHVNSIGEAYE